MPKAEAHKWSNPESKAYDPVPELSVLLDEISVRITEEGQTRERTQEAEKVKREVLVEFGNLTLEINSFARDPKVLRLLSAYGTADERAEKTGIKMTYERMYELTHEVNDMLKNCFAQSKNKELEDSEFIAVVEGAYKLVAIFEKLTSADTALFAEDARGARDFEKLVAPYKAEKELVQHNIQNILRREMH